MQLALSMRREAKMPLLVGFRHSHLLSLLLHDDDLERKFFLRQGLWTEGLRTPPGQECSNGSLTFFAVVLWRTFSQ